MLSARCCGKVIAVERFVLLGEQGHLVVHPKRIIILII